MGPAPCGSLMGEDTSFSTPENGRKTNFMYAAAHIVKLHFVKDARSPVWCRGEAYTMMQMEMSIRACGRKVSEKVQASRHT